MDSSMVAFVAILGILVVLLILFITVVYRFVPSRRSGYKGYYYEKSTEFEDDASKPKTTKTQEFQPGKTVWDWQQLLIIPFVLALVTVGYSLVQNAHSQMLATDQQQQTTLETYIDRMSGLLLNKSSTSTLLHDSKSSDEVRNVAQAITLIALSRLDPERKRAVIFFLYHADLITWHQWPKAPGGEFPIVNLTTADLEWADLSNIFLNNAYLYNINLNDANLSNAVLSIADLGDSNLSGADLSGTYLTGANLNSADLTGAHLSGAHLETYMSGLPPGAQQVTYLSGANLKGADLSGANLSGANLKGADLSGANLSGANLKGADLSGATMPDGSKHP